MMFFDGFKQSGICHANANRAGIQFSAGNQPNPLPAHSETKMAKFKTDIEIARAAKKRPIQEIGKKLGIGEKDLVPYGHDKAKVSADFIAKAEEEKRRQADPGDSHQSDTCRRRQDHNNRWPWRWPECHRQKGNGLHPRSVAWPVLRHEGRRCRRRLCPDRSDGRHEPAFYRRFPRHYIGAQSSVRNDRQPHLLGQ